MPELAIDLKDFNVIYKDKIYNNCVKCIPFVFADIHDNNRNTEVKEMDILYLDETNRLRILSDKVDEFQLVRK